MIAQEVGSVVIVGAGNMGHSISLEFARAGLQVNLVDNDPNALERALNLIQSGLKTLTDFQIVPPTEFEAITGRIHPTLDIRAACRHVGFALEAVPEVPSIKKEVLETLGEFCPERTILASNTSSLDVFEFCEIYDPSRLVMTHWFNPPHVIPLVEVAAGPKTSPQVMNHTVELMQLIGKKPVVLQSFVPGFIVNRIQFAITDCVLELIENEWATPEDIDMAVKTSVGIRLPIVGVSQTLDFVGLRLVADWLKTRGKESTFINAKLRDGSLGAVSAKGLFDYSGRSEEAILAKRDEKYLRLLQFLEKIDAFGPV